MHYTHSTATRRLFVVKIARIVIEITSVPFVFYRCSCVLGLVAVAHLHGLTVFFSAGGEGSVDMVEMALRMASEPQDSGMCLF